MPWKNQGGGPWGSGPKGPWGSGPQSVGPRPPDLEDLLRRGQDRLQQMLPGGYFSGMGIAIILLIALVIWGLSGFFRVQSEELGVILRFGKHVKTVQPGLRLDRALPRAVQEQPAHPAAHGLHRTAVPAGVPAARAAVTFVKSQAPSSKSQPLPSLKAIPTFQGPTLPPSAGGWSLGVGSPLGFGSGWDLGFGARDLIPPATAIIVP